MLGIRKWLWIEMDMGGFVLGLFKTKREAREDAINKSITHTHAPLRIFSAPIEWYKDGKKVKETILPEITRVAWASDAEVYTWSPENVAKENERYLAEKAKANSLYDNINGLVKEKENENNKPEIPTLP